MPTRKEHWEKIYQHKEFAQTSWYQEMPTTSIEFLESAKLPRSAKIIDVGGGESQFVNYLLAEGYQDITVLDISQNAIDKKQQELGEAAHQIRWIVSDIIDFRPDKQYDFWHDRATFHFLTADTEVEKHIKTMREFIVPEGILVIGVFSENGPTKCSGLEIKQYSEHSLSERISRFFHKIRCITTDHLTPFDTIQNFVFCSFRRLPTSAY